MLLFQHKEYLWGLLLILPLLFLFINLWLWKKRTTRKLGDPRLVKTLLRSYSPRLFSLKCLLLLLAFAAGITAIANLRTPASGETISRKGIDVMIALDVSKSMLATDLQPSRLERARQLINKLIDRLPDDRIGIVYFAGKAYLQMPLTVDHIAAKIFIGSASPDLVPSQGTVISEALQMSNRAFNNKDGRFKTIILVSDGEDHEPGITEAVNEMTDAGVMVNTVGIGSAEGATIIDPATGQPKTDAMGNTVISRLDETSLQLLAEKTQGTYIHLESTDQAVDQLVGQLSQIEGKGIADTSLINYDSYYWAFAGLMLLLLAGEFFIPERKKLSV